MVLDSNIAQKNVTTNFKKLQEQVRKYYISLYFDPQYNSDIDLDNIDYDKYNAFEHAFGSALIAYRTSAEEAWALGLAKEVYTKDAEIEMHTNNDRTFDETMQIVIGDTNRDLWNDLRGIEIAIKAKETNKSLNDIAIEIFKDIQNNENSNFIIDINDPREWEEGCKNENIWNVAEEKLNDITSGNKKILYKYALPSFFLKALSDSNDTSQENLSKISLPEQTIPNFTFLPFGQPAYADEIYPNFYPLYNKAKGADGLVQDPIILDLDGNGIETTSINNGVYFDYEVDGYAESSAWVKGNDGILVVDSNDNGVIDNGSELVLYDKLTEYDENNDGMIDSNDENFSELKIIKGDGTLQSLQDAGIKFISLNTQNVNNIDENDNTQFAKGTFGKTNGTINEYGEYNLQTAGRVDFSLPNININTNNNEIFKFRSLLKSDICVSLL